MSNTSKITKKGQVTIPKSIRTLLGANVVEFEVKGEDVLIRPVKSVAGSLSGYAEKPVPLEKIRGSVWDDVVRRKKR